MREGQTLAEESRRAEDFPRPGGGDARSGRIDRRIAGHAELGGRVLRGRRADRLGRGDGSDRAGDPDFHGSFCRRQC